MERVYELSRLTVDRMSTETPVKAPLHRASSNASAQSPGPNQPSYDADNQEGHNNILPVINLPPNSVNPNPPTFSAVAESSVPITYVRIGGNMYKITFTPVTSGGRRNKKTRKGRRRN